MKDFSYKDTILNHEEQNYVLGLVLDVLISGEVKVENPKDIDDTVTRSMIHKAMSYDNGYKDETAKVEDGEKQSKNRKDVSKELEKLRVAMIKKAKEIRDIDDIGEDKYTAGYIKCVDNVVKELDKILK